MFVHQTKINEQALGKYLFYYFKIFGIACMTLKRQNFKGKTKISEEIFVASKLGVAYNACFFLYLITSNYFSIKIIYSKYYKQETQKFEKIYNSILDVFTIVSATIILSKFIFGQKKTIEIANELYRMNQSIMIRNSGLYGENFFWRDVFIMFFIVSLIWCVKLITFYWNNEKYIFFIALLIYTNSLIITALILQYSSILKLLENMFRIINAKLLETTQQPINYIPDFHCQVATKYGFAKVEKLLQTRRLYIALFNTSQSISKFYSLPIMLCILNTFGAIICSVYYVTKPIALGKASLPTSMFIGGISYGIVYASLLVTLTQCVTTTTSESKRTGEIVNECLMNCENQIIIEKLNQFSNYLMHAKVEFTVFKLFPLDQTLLMSILGVTTTYLVIILQFQQPI